MEDYYKTIEKIYLLIIEIRKDIEKAKMSWLKDPSRTDIAVLNKLMDAEDELHNMIVKIEKYKKQM